MSLTLFSRDLCGQYLTCDVMCSLALTRGVSLHAGAAVWGEAGGKHGGPATWPKENIGRMVSFFERYVKR